MKRANKNFLLAEYERYRKKPQSVHINNREIIIPCEYTLGGNAPEVVRKNFLYDYFDLQKREADKYKKAGVAPRLIEFGGVHYIVPFNCRRREIPDTKIFSTILYKKMNLNIKSIFYFDSKNPTLVHLQMSSLLLLLDEQL